MRKIIFSLTCIVFISIPGLLVANTTYYYNIVNNTDSKIKLWGIGGKCWKHGDLPQDDGSGNVIDPKTSSGNLMTYKNRTSIGCSGSNTHEYTVDVLKLEEGGDESSPPDWVPTYSIYINGSAGAYTKVTGGSGDTTTTVKNDLHEKQCNTITFDNATETTAGISMAVSQDEGIC